LTVIYVDHRIFEESVRIRLANAAAQLAFGSGKTKGKG